MKHIHGYYAVCTRAMHLITWIGEQLWRQPAIITQKKNYENTHGTICRSHSGFRCFFFHAATIFFCRCFSACAAKANFWRQFFVPCSKKKQIVSEIVPWGAKFLPHSLDAIPIFSTFTYSRQAKISRYICTIGHMPNGIHKLFTITALGVGNVIDNSYIWIRNACTLYMGSRYKYKRSQVQANISKTTAHW